ncbi:MAG TPA: S41 family peptidase [Blastocatellia bacterium]|nr:S41 family peptidase [Blastocatellia bacterium]
MKSLRLAVAAVLIFVTINATCILFAQGQGPAQQPDRTIDSAERDAVIDGLIKLLNDNYVFPDTAKKMEDALRTHQQNKEYDNITSAISFVQTLTKDLQDVSHDKHLRMFYSFQAVPPRDPQSGPSPEQIAQQREQLRTTNYGFEKLERMDGNIGYLELRGFTPASEAAETIVAAMNFLANTDALIIDLRRNGGGAPATVQLIASYLFDGDNAHLNDLYFRGDGSTRQWWSLPYVPGKRYGRSKPVYILTSNRTFSAAEEFTYDLQNLKRATIVGEVTGGGANPGGTRRITDHFGAFIPTGRAINPVTKTNWEGVGIKPDIEVPADKALKTAQLAALKEIVQKVTDEQRKNGIQHAIDSLQKEMDGSR